MKKILLLSLLNFSFYSHAQKNSEILTNFQSFEGNAFQTEPLFFGEPDANQKISPAEKLARDQFLTSKCPNIKIELERKGTKKIKALLLKQFESDELITRLTEDDYQSLGTFGKKDIIEQRVTYSTFLLMTNGAIDQNRREFYLSYRVQIHFGGNYNGEATYDVITRKCDYIIQ